jgi:hypothetical protein
MIGEANMSKIQKIGSLLQGKFEKKKKEKLGENWVAILPLKAR